MWPSAPCSAAPRTAVDARRRHPRLAPGGIPGLTATAGDASADIAFTPPAGVITRYEYSLDGGSTFAGAAVTSPGHVQITGLTNGVGSGSAFVRSTTPDPGRGAPRCP